MERNPKGITAEVDGSLPVTIKSPLEPNGSIPVTLQDQTTPPIIIYANQVTNITTLAVEAVKDDKVITVTSAAGWQ